MSLLHLYDTILVPILSDWIWSDDLCCLDTAVCSTQLRPSWLVTLSKCKVMNPKYCVSLEDKEWMLMRGVQQRTLLVQDSVHISAKTAAVLYRQLSLVTFENFDDEELKKLLLNHTIDGLKLTIDRNAISSEYGHMVVDIKVDGSHTEEFYCKLGACCPSLKHFHTYSYKDEPILPLIQGCTLDTIKGSNLRYLLSGSVVRQKHRCDLTRVPVQDEKTVCLGEGKYYHVTGLVYLDSDEDDDEICFIAPFLSTLTSLCLNDSSSLAVLASVHCRNLTSLEVTDVCNIVKEVVALIAGSKALVELKLDCDDFELNGRKLVNAAALNCPRLRFLDLGSINAGYRAMSLLFQNCPELVEVEVSSYFDARSVVHYAKNATSLSFSSRLSGLLRTGHCDGKLYLACDMSESTMIDIVKQNPDVRYLGLNHAPYTNDSVVDKLVGLCPHLTRLEIRIGSEVGQRLCSVAQCDKLTSLALHFVKFADESVLMELFRNKTLLRHLNLNSCGTFSGDVFNLIASTCSELKSLDLSQCHITTKHVVALLTSCLQLKTLVLTNCPEVDSDVLPFIKSAPCLREVELGRCKIVKDQITLLNDGAVIKIF